MSDFKFKLNGKGVRELMQSGKMQSILMEKASQLASQAGAGYSHNFKMGKRRGVAEVVTDTDDAVKDNNEHNTLLHLIGKS